MRELLFKKSSGNVLQSCSRKKERKPMRYYLHLALPVDFSLQVAQFSEMFQGRRRSSPHLTIVVPRFSKSQTRDRGISATVRKLARQLRPFQLAILGLAKFESTLALRVERSDEFVFAQQRFSTKLDGLLWSSTSQYVDIPTPHITLAKHLSPG